MGTDVCATDGFVLTECGYGTGSCSSPGCDGSFGSCASDQTCINNACEACGPLMGTYVADVCDPDGFVVTECGYGTRSCSRQSCDGSFGSCDSA
eukprot:1933056-Rhodomonas_salina.1